MLSLVLPTAKSKNTDLGKADGRSRSSAKTKLSADVIERASGISTSMIDEMEKMRSSTEHAALSIGSLLECIVTLATEGNAEVQATLSDAVGRSVGEDGETESLSINELVVRQVDVVNNFINDIRSFLSEQVELAQEAHEACETINKSATDVAVLSRTSQMLSINLRIEAARLGTEGKSFTALGQEVQTFSTSMLEAAEDINASVGGFLNTIPKIREKAMQMENDVTELSNNFQGEMSALSGRTEKMHHSLNVTLDQVERKNNEILSCSNETLSHLAFQDPVSQGLERAKHNVLQLQGVIEGNTPDFICLSEIRDDVGRDGQTECEAGEVDLF